MVVFYQNPFCTLKNLNKLLHTSQETKQEFNTDMIYNPVIYVPQHIYVR